MSHFERSNVTPDRIDKVKLKEDRLRRFLFPLEGYVLEVERILVWDRPLYSALLLVAVNIFFWLATTWHLLSVIGFTGFIVVAVEGCVHYIWPNANDNSSGDHTSEWTEIHPQLLGIPELSRMFAEKWQAAEDRMDDAVTLHVTNRAKFFVTSVFLLSTVAVFGMYVPGLYIVYGIIMVVLVWPAVCYNNIIDKVSHVMRPVVEAVERKLNIKRSKASRGEAVTNDDDSDDDEELRAFIPDTSLPFTDDDDDRSCDHSDDDLLSDDLPHFACGLGTEMPSFDETHSSFTPRHREMPSIDHLDDCSRGSDSIAFIPTHFRKSSSSSKDDENDVEPLAEGLTFDEVSHADVDTDARDVVGLLGDFISHGKESLVSAMSSSAPSVATALAATAVKLGGMASAVRDAVVSSMEQKNENFEEKEEKARSDVIEETGDVIDKEFVFLERDEFDAAINQSIHQ